MWAEFNSGGSDNNSFQLQHPAKTDTISENSDVQDINKRKQLEKSLTSAQAAVENAQHIFDMESWSDSWASYGTEHELKKAQKNFTQLQKQLTHLLTTQWKGVVSYGATSYNTNNKTLHHNYNNNSNPDDDFQFVVNTELGGSQLALWGDILWWPEKKQTWVAGRLVGGKKRSQAYAKVVQQFWENGEYLVSGSASKDVKKGDSSTNPDTGTTHDYDTEQTGIDIGIDRLFVDMQDDIIQKNGLESIGVHFAQYVVEDVDFPDYVQFKNGAGEILDNGAVVNNDTVTGERVRYFLQGWKQYRISLVYSYRLSEQLRVSGSFDKSKTQYDQRGNLDAHSESSNGGNIQFDGVTGNTRWNAGVRVNPNNIRYDTGLTIYQWGNGKLSFGVSHTDYDRWDDVTEWKFTYSYQFWKNSQKYRPALVDQHNTVREKLLTHDNGVGDGDIQIDLREWKEVLEVLWTVDCQNGANCEIVADGLDIKFDLANSTNDGANILSNIDTPSGSIIVSGGDLVLKNFFENFQSIAGQTINLAVQDNGGTYQLFQIDTQKGSVNIQNAAVNIKTAAALDPIVVQAFIDNASTSYTSAEVVTLITDLLSGTLSVAIINAIFDGSLSTTTVQSYLAGTLSAQDLDNQVNNVAPTLSSFTPVITGSEWVAYSASWAFNDVNGNNTLTIAANNLPSFLTLTQPNPVDGTFIITGTPWFTDAGVYTNISVMALDDQGESVFSTPFTLTIAEVNQAISISDTSPTFPTAVGKDPQTGNIVGDTGATDPDGNTVTVQNPQTFTGANGTLAVVANGNYTYTPNPGATGNDTITWIVLQDGSGSQVTVSLEFNNIDTQALSYVSDTLNVTTPSTVFSWQTVTVDGSDINQASSSFRFVSAGTNNAAWGSVSIDSAAGGIYTVSGTTPAGFGFVQIEATFVDTSGNTQTVLLPTIHNLVSSFNGYSTDAGQGSINGDWTDAPAISKWDISDGEQNAIPKNFESMTPEEVLAHIKNEPKRDAPAPIREAAPAWSRKDDEPLPGGWTQASNFDEQEGNN